MSACIRGGSGGVVIVNLFRATADGFELAARLHLVSTGRAEFEVRDNAAKQYLGDLRDHGIWSRKLRRTIHMDEGDAFLDAVVESLRSSSYWHATVEDAPVAAQRPAELAGAN